MKNNKKAANGNSGIVTGPADQGETEREVRLPADRDAFSRGLLKAMMAFRDGRFEHGRVAARNPAGLARDLAGRDRHERGLRRSDLEHQIEPVGPRIALDVELEPLAPRRRERSREGAHVLSGCFESGATAAVAQVAEQKGVPFVINIAADPQITEQGYKFVFRNFPTSGMLGVGGLSLMNELFQATGKTPKTVVVLLALMTRSMAAR